MVERIKAIEFAEGVRSIDNGEGGHAGDREHLGELADIKRRVGRGWWPCRERSMAWNWA